MSMEIKLPKIIIDGKTYEVEEGQNLLRRLFSLGLNLPYFCWHPAMGSVGACRQCAVKKYKDENDENGKIVMACMEPVKDNLRIGLIENEAEEFRAGVIEWLMTNHPHDCPVCDEGGECHLQDMTVMTGHDYRRYSFKKRTYENQYLGPFIYHEMNRCIQCYRCVRFYRDYAGGRDFDVFAAHNHVYFGRSEEGVLENEFSGNLVEVCPTGVFTDKTLRKHYTRKWDLTNSPSICTHCSLGCNTIAAERYGTLRRILSRFNHQVNDYFLCDRGRFGYEFVNSERRIYHSLKRNSKSETFKQIDNTSVSKDIADIIKSGKSLGIGSPRASLESNYSLMELVGKENFYAGISSNDFKQLTLIHSIMKDSPAHIPSMNEIRKSDAVLILGEDILNTAPMYALAIQQSVKQKPMKHAEKLNVPLWQDAAVREATQESHGPLFIASMYSTKLKEIAMDTYTAAPANIARLGFGIAHALTGKTKFLDDGELNEDENQIINKIVEELKNAESPVIISGTQCNSEDVIKASANVAAALHSINNNCSLSFVVPEANSFGLAMMSLKNLDDAFDIINKGEAENIIILENDLYRRKEKKAVDQFLQKCKNVVALDSFENATTKKASVVGAVGTFAESDGTFINNECRAQRFYQVYVPSALFGEDKSEIIESWRFINNISNELKPKRTEINLENVIKSLVKKLPQFERMQNITPPPGFREAGQKIPREPHRYSGRTAMHAHTDVSEPMPPVDEDSALTFTMEGYQGQPPSSIIPFFWSPGWNSVQSINKYQIEVGGPLHGGDPGRRLFDEPKSTSKKYFEEVPPKFNPKEGEWFALPIHHIFGSDELSNMAPAVAERSA